MRKSYLLVYNGATGTREAIRDFLDRLPEVLNWRYETPYSFFLVSEESARHLAFRLRAFAQDEHAAFAVIEITGNSFGWLTPKTWQMIQHTLAPGEKPPPTQDPMSPPK